MQTKQKIVAGGIWLGISGLVSNILSALGTIVLARLLTPEDYGIVALAVTIQTILASVTELSLGQALIHLKDLNKKDLDLVWTAGAIRALLLCSILVLLSGVVAGFYEDPRIGPVMLVSSLGLLVSGAANPRRFELQKNLVFHKEAAITISHRAVSFALIVVLAVVWRNYWAIVIGTLFGNLVGCILSYALLPYIPRPRLAGIRRLMGFSIWLTAGQIVNTLNWRAEFLFIGKLSGPTGLGYYSMGNNLAMLPTRETSKPLKQAVYPGFAKVIHDSKRLPDAYQRAQALMTAVSLPIAVGFALVAEPLLLWIGEDKWRAAIPIVQVLSCIFGIQTLGSLVQPLAMANGLTKKLFIRDSQMLLVRLPMILVALFLWGIYGVVFARLVSGTIATVVNMKLVGSITGLSVRKQLAVNVRTILSTCVMSVAAMATLYWLKSGHVMTPFLLQATLVAVAGALAYLGAHFGLWHLSGRPPGPETDLVDLIFKMKAKWKRTSRTA